MLRGDFRRYLLFGLVLFRILLFRILLFGILLLADLLILVLSPTAHQGREPGTGLADDLVFVLALGLMLGRDAIIFFRRLSHRPAATSRRAAEPGAGQSDHRAAGVRTIPRVLIRFHGRAQ